MDNTIPDTTPQKQCTGPCGQFLPSTLEYFGRHRIQKSGLHPRCKKCRSEQRKADRNNRPEVRESERANSKKWQRENREYSREQKRLYHETHKEEAKARYQEHKQERTAYNKQWYDTHQEHIVEYRKNYYEAHKEKARAYSIAHTKANPIQNRYHAHVRRMRVHGSGGKFTSQQIKDQLKRQKYKCYYTACGQAKFKIVDGKHIYHIDHVVPLSRGGRNDIDNIVLACPTCNDRKHARLPHEWPEGGRLF